MEKTEIVNILENLKELPYEHRRDELKKYPIKILESLAAELYERYTGRNHDKKNSQILDDILSTRAAKLDDNFEWTNENKQKFLNVSDKIMQVFESAYNEALTIASDLENRIKNNDKFIKDYEIEIEINFYLSDKFYNDENGRIFGYVLSEPLNYNPIQHYFSHSYRDEFSEKPIYLDKTENWNSEYFGGVFNDNYICYGIHALLDTHIWSFNDIANIEKIWADVKVWHQHYIYI